LKTQEARALGEHIAALVRNRQTAEAYDHLSPILAERTPFDMLRRIGEPIGVVDSHASVDAFLDLIATDETEGGWVVIASTLEQMLGHNMAGALARCRDFVILASVWYAASTMGEGVVGQALVRHFQPALELLAPWRNDPDPWVRRAVGVGAHFWAKRSRGELLARAEMLLAFLEPMFEEWDVSAVKGVGWGLKTLGRHYPDLMMDWLPKQINRRHRAIMLRKAVTYLSEEQRAIAAGETSRDDKN
jgi:hypothetical protein